MQPGDILSPIVPSIISREPKTELNVRPMHRKDQFGTKSPSSPTIIPYISPFRVRATSGSNGIEEKEMSSHNVHENDSKRMIASRETEMLSHPDEGRFVLIGHHGVDHERKEPGVQMEKSSNQAEGTQSIDSSSPKMRDLAATGPVQLISDSISQLAFPGAADYEHVELQKTASLPQFIPDSNTKNSPGNDCAGKSGSEATKPAPSKALEVLSGRMPLHPGRDKAAIPGSDINPSISSPTHPHDDLSSIGPVPDKALRGAADSASPPVFVPSGPNDAGSPINASSTGMSTAPTGSMAEINVEKNNAGMLESSIVGVNSPRFGNISDIGSSYPAAGSSEERGDRNAGTVDNSIVAYDSKPNGQPTEPTPSKVIEDLSERMPLHSGRDKAAIPSSDISPLTFRPMPLHDDPHDNLSSIGPVLDHAPKGAKEDSASPPVPVPAGPNDVNPLTSSLSAGLRTASTGSVAEANIEKNSPIMPEEISIGGVNSPSSASISEMLSFSMAARSREAGDKNAAIKVIDQENTDLQPISSAPLPSSKSREQVLSAFDIYETINMKLSDAKKISRQRKPSGLDSNIINPESYDKEKFWQTIPHIGKNKPILMSKAINRASNEDKIGHGQKPDDQSKRVSLEVADQTLSQARAELLIESAYEDGKKPDTSLAKGGFKTVISSPDGRRRVSHVSQDELSHNRSMNADNSALADLPGKITAIEPRTDRIAGPNAKKTESDEKSPEHLEISEISERLKKRNESGNSIRVTIGRIDVRADSPLSLQERQKRATPASHSALRLSLDDYLKQRNEGNI